MNAKVITTCFQGKERRVGESHTFPTHKQDITKPVHVLEMLRKVVELESEYDAGIPMDTIIVNNDVGFAEGNEYIKWVDGQRTKNGTIRAYTRPNIGWSFGGYADAFDRFTEYDYWLFTEDDIIVGGTNYYKRLIDRFTLFESLNIPVGFFALVKVIRHAYGIHCGGGVGFTSKKILMRVKERHGSLPYFDKPEDKKLSLVANRQNAIKFGEVAFTNKIDELGLYLFDFGENNSWNLEKNLCIPYYNYVH